MGAFTFLDVGPAIAGGLAALVAGGVGAYWYKEHNKLSGKIIQELVDESNSEQDRVLVEKLRELRDAGHHGYAASLAAFVDYKQKIEKASHADGGLTQQKQEIEKLVDDVVFGAVDHYDHLVALDSRLAGAHSLPMGADQVDSINETRRDISARLHEAIGVLDHTYHNLRTLLNPAHDMDGPDFGESTLDRAIRELRDEQDRAERVRTRMRSDWENRFPAAPERNEEGNDRANEFESE